jgi:hypothetical protein
MSTGVATSFKGGTGGDWLLLYDQVEKELLPIWCFFGKCH